MIDMVLRFSSLGEVNKFLKANDVSGEEADRLVTEWKKAQGKASAASAPASTPAPAPAPSPAEDDEEIVEEPMESDRVELEAGMTKKVMSAASSALGTVKK